MEAWIAGLAGDAALLLALGALDYRRGEAWDWLIAAVLASGFALYALLPLRCPLSAILAFTGAALTAAFMELNRAGVIGGMDVVLGPHIPVAALLPVALPHGWAYPLLALSAATAGLYAHAARVKSLTCSGRLWGRVGAKSWLAWDKWYILPVGVHPDDTDEEEAIRREWARSKKCVSARVGIPLVWVYSLYHAVIVAAVLAAYISINW